MISILGSQIFLPAALLLNPIPISTIMPFGELRFYSFSLTYSFIIFFFSVSNNCELCLFFLFWFQLRENCYKRVREDRTRLLWKMRLPAAQSLNHKVLFVTSLFCFFSLLFYVLKFIAYMISFYLMNILNYFKVLKILLKW